MAKWMEKTEARLTRDGKRYLLKKQKTIYGLFFVHEQGHFRCYCDYEQKDDLLDLYTNDDYLDPNLGEELFFTKYEFWSLKQGIKSKSKYLQEIEEELDSLGAFFISIVMAKAIINLKNDPELKEHFSSDAEIGVCLLDYSCRQTCYPASISNYNSESKIIKYLIKQLTDTEENQELILDLIKKEPIASGLELHERLSMVSY